MYVHYIYVDRHDKFSTVIPDEVLALQNLYSDPPDGIDLNFKFWSYSRLYEEISEFDQELGRLFSIIDPDFGACMADIGRIFCLYKYGGIYHDARLYVDSPSFIARIANILSNHGKALEKHPQKNVAHGCRNTNIAGLAGENYFKRVLLRMRGNLLSEESKILSSPDYRPNMWTTTTMAFLSQLLEDERLDPNSYNVHLIPGHDAYVVRWSISSRPKFYNDGMSNHWSTLQMQKPFLMHERPS